MYDAPDGHTGDFKTRPRCLISVRKVGRMGKELVALRPLGLIFDLACRWVMCMVYCASGHENTGSSRFFLPYVVQGSAIMA